MPQLSVVIITFNEEQNIARCLESVQGIADDVVVVDSFSSDLTEAICKKFNVNFVQRKWEGYSDTKNFGNSIAKYDWILSLDADEALSEPLKASILKAKQDKELKTYKFNRLTNYCGSWIRHCGWYPDTKTRIFDRRRIRWEGVLHEKLTERPGEAIQLQGDCLHYSYYSREQHYRQAEKFTDIASKELFEKGQTVSFIKFIISPAVKFIRDYFIKLGFLDGKAGYIVCRISAYATYLKYKKLRDLYSEKR